MSIMVPLFLGSTLRANSFILSSIPNNSSSVSPLSAKFDRNEAFSESEVFPERISVMTPLTSSYERSIFSSNFLIKFDIIFFPLPV